MDQELSVIERLTEVGREATRFDFDKMSLSPDTEKFYMNNLAHY